MTISISRRNVSLALLFPAGALLFGLWLANNPVGVDPLGVELPEVVAVGAGISFAAAGVFGVGQLLWHMAKPADGLSWDEHHVEIRVGLGRGRRIPRDAIHTAVVSTTWPNNIEVRLDGGETVDVYTWMLDIPDGWSRDDVASELPIT